MKEWKKELRKVSTDKSFDACSRKENREMGQWLERDVDLGNNFFFSFFKVRAIMCLYVDRNYLFTEGSIAEAEGKEVSSLEKGK